MMGIYLMIFCLALIGGLIVPTYLEIYTVIFKEGQLVLLNIIKWLEAGDVSLLKKVQRKSIWVKFY